MPNIHSNGEVISDDASLYLKSELAARHPRRAAQPALSKETHQTTMTRPAARRDHPTAERGFSLLEVMIAAVILILVFYGLAQFYARGRTQIDFEEDRRKATAVGQERIEEARRWTYAYLEFLDGSVVDTAMTVDGQDYTVSLAVNPNDEPPPANDDISVVKVGVIWDRRPTDSGVAVPDTLWLTTLVGRRYP